MHVLEGFPTLHCIHNSYPMQWIILLFYWEIKKGYHQTQVAPIISALYGFPSIVCLRR